MKKLVIFGGAALTGLMVAAPAALAQDSGSVVDGYGGCQGGIQSDVDGGGSLPFTGLDLGLLIGGGLLLLAVGFGLRRLARGNS